ncbi:FixH family protein [Cohnella mopanensis]|uniref:FixH family protein n=1 Tax=Cohnella mopanensis TaxID=2911966 RepID=UPI001EF810D6|nr:FixH family protein [Cohnella mopanensis]
MNRVNRRISLAAVAVMLLVTLSLSGCSSGGNSASAAGNSDGTLDIRFTTAPEKLSAAGTSSLNLEIKAKAKPVVGASVIFEIWPKGEEQHAQLNAKSVEDGLYFIKGEFSQVGDYYLLAHVTTAEGVHEMKTFEFSIQ